MKSLCNGEVIIESGGLIIWRESAGLQPQKTPRNPQNQNLLTDTFLDMTISNVLCDSPFSRKHP